MTRKDYKLIARVVATIADDGLRHDIAQLFARLLKEDNPNFHDRTFLIACGIITNIEKIKVND
jgi:hypothetical protein